MNYETFKSSAITSIQKYFGESVSVSLQPIIKNNNIQLDGLMIQDSSKNITPTIYLNYYYEDYLAGKPLSSVFDDIISAYQENLPEKNLDLSFFTDFEKVKYQIIYKLVNYGQNSKILKNIPHFRLLDLAIVFCCYLSDMSGENATILIHNHHLALWSITEEMLYDIAIKNTPILLPYELKSMEDTLKSLCPDYPMYSDYSNTASKLPVMYVLSNTEKFYGASAMLYPQVLSYFADSINQDLYIIPSSIHEVLLLPKNFCHHIADLNHMIKDINATQVLEEEILSDHVYFFERDLGFLTL